MRTTKHNTNTQRRIGGERVCSENTPGDRGALPPCLERGVTRHTQRAEQRQGASTAPWDTTGHSLESHQWNTGTTHHLRAPPAPPLPHIAKGGDARHNRRVPSLRDGEGQRSKARSGDDLEHRGGRRRRSSRAPPPPPSGFRSAGSAGDFRTHRRFICVDVYAGINIYIDVYYE